VRRELYRNELQRHELEAVDRSAEVGDEIVLPDGLCDASFVGEPSVDEGVVALALEVGGGGGGG